MHGIDLLGPPLAVATGAALALVALAAAWNAYRWRRSAPPIPPFSRWERCELGHMHHRSEGTRDCDELAADSRARAFFSSVSRWRAEA